MFAFWDGVLAGYGIAVPVGAIAILIVDMGLRRGFRAAFLAGAGAATADFLYAGLAAVLGEIAALALAPYATPLRILSAFVLLALGSVGLRQAMVTLRRQRTVARPEVTLPTTSLRRYLQFLGLTLLNPLTVVYFGALILGRGAAAPNTPLARVAFVLGAGLASLSWQTLLAALGSLGRRRLTPRAQVALSVTGNLVIIALGLRILLA